MEILNKLCAHIPLEHLHFPHSMVIETIEYEMAFGVIIIWLS